MKSQVKGKRRRRARGSLTRDQVVEAALELADERGIEALTMQTLSRRLDCGVMTIYGYVANKEDLLNAISQRGLANLRLARPLPTDPTGLLIAWGRALREALVQHPSLPMIFLSQAVVGPGIFRGIEAMLSALGRVGMPPGTAVHATYAVVTYTTGFAAWEVPRTRRQPQSRYAAEWRREFAGLNPDDFPLSGSVLEELPKVAGSEQFETGLAALAFGLTHTG
jgi:TetR/AcrR family tetracycline transcriptional repressor